jgi:hypothetical protein
MRNYNQRSKKITSGKYQECPRSRNRKKSEQQNRSNQVSDQYCGIQEWNEGGEPW